MNVRKVIALATVAAGALLRADPTHSLVKEASGKVVAQVRRRE